MCLNIKIPTKQLQKGTCFPVCSIMFGYQLCDAGYQSGPEKLQCTYYLIHDAISGKGTVPKSKTKTHFLFCRRCLSCVSEYGDHLPCRCKNAMGIYMVAFTGSDAANIPQATDFSRKHPCIHAVPNGEEVQTSASAYL